MQVEDAHFFLKLVNTPKWKKYIGDRDVNTVEDAKNYIKERMLPQLIKLGFGNYLVIRKDDNLKMGTCGLYDREGIQGVDIGFAFLPEFEKKGYAYEAAQKVKTIGVEVFNISKISGITIPENIASQKLLEKLGLKFIKIISLPNDSEELMLYELNI
jgi:RimJ/RimL family protein N-acetyltransferase